MSKTLIVSRFTEVSVFVCICVYDDIMLCCAFCVSDGFVSSRAQESFLIQIATILQQRIRLSSYELYFVLPIVMSARPVVKTSHMAPAMQEFAIMAAQVSHPCL